MSDEANSKRLTLISQAISDLSQQSLAVAIGLFGVLAISVGIDQSLRHHGLVEWYLYPAWAWLSKAILFTAYLGLILLGSVCIILHKFYSLLQEKYISKTDKDLLNKIQETAKISLVLKTVMQPFIKNIDNSKASFLTMYWILIPFIVISSLMGIFIILV